MTDEKEISELTTEELDKYCSTSDSKVLAAHIVVYRLLHIQKELAKLCMTELSKRANNGDQFDFEGYITEKLSKMPKPMDSEKKMFLERIMKTDMSKI